MSGAQSRYEGPAATRGGLGALLHVRLDFSPISSLRWNSKISSVVVRQSRARSVLLLMRSTLTPIPTEVTRALARWSGNA